jgi:hypothetical protein
MSGEMLRCCQFSGDACFCTHSAMQGFDVVLFILALAKTVIHQLVLGN